MRTYRMWWAVLVVAGLAGCAVSGWERHQQAMHEDASRADWAAAEAEEQWLIKNAIVQGPVEERSRQAEAARQLQLAQYAAKAGDTRTGVQALRDALATDPSQAPAVRRQLDALQLSPAEAERVRYEFAWNLAALDPGEQLPSHAEPEAPVCWSYRVQEVRIRQRLTIRTTNGMERQVTYDARSWVYDAAAHAWSADGAWADDVATEAEPVNGPERARYRAVTAAEHEFLADGPIPPCHHQAWRGPFETDGTIFVARELPTG